MCTQLHRLREPRCADRALVRPISGVYSFVHHKMRVSDEPLSARSTDVRLDPGVGPEVLGDVAGLAERLVADRTRERSRTGVHALVVAQLAHRAEPLVTRAALERPLSVVDALVNNQLRGARVRFAADVTTVRTLT